MPLPRPTRQIHKDDEPQIVEPVKKVEERLRPSDVFRFAPKPDITAEELAYLVSVFWTIDVDNERFFKFPKDLHKHFDPVDNAT